LPVEIRRGGLRLEDSGQKDCRAPEGCTLGKVAQGWTESAWINRHGVAPGDGHGSVALD